MKVSFIEEVTGVITQICKVRMLNMTAGNQKLVGTLLLSARTKLAGPLKTDTAGKTEETGLFLVFLKSRQPQTYY